MGEGVGEPDRPEGRLEWRLEGRLVTLATMERMLIELLASPPV